MKFIEILKETIKDLDPKLKILMNNGLKFTFILILISCYIFLTYQHLGDLSLFYIGVSLFKSALSFGVTFFIFAIGFNRIKKEIL